VEAGRRRVTTELAKLAEEYFKTSSKSVEASEARTYVVELSATGGRASDDTLVFIRQVYFGPFIALDSDVKAA
jgi:hypothetical protein